MLQIYKSLESGPLQELTLKTLEKGAWINIVDPTPYELKVVSNLTEVDPDFLRSALDDEERSHTDVEENSVMVLTNVPVFRGEDSYDALPLAIIVTDEYIITVCLEETPVITEFNERTSRLFRTYKKTRFLFQILYKSATYFLRYLRQISKLSEEIEDQLRHDMKNSEILRLLELQKGLTYFNAAIRSNGAVLDKLLRMRNNTSLTPILKAYEEDEDLLEDVIIENKQAKEMVEMYSKILARLADTFSSIISNNQNLVMKFLAAMTIILAIPTVVSSFFGMNVPVPFAENAHGFLYVMCIAFSISIVSAYVLWLVAIWARRQGTGAFAGLLSLSGRALLCSLPAGAASWAAQYGLDGLRASGTLALPAVAHACLACAASGLAFAVIFLPLSYRLAPGILEPVWRRLRRGRPQGQA